MLKTGEELKSMPTYGPEDQLTWQLITESREIPDEFKPNVVATIHHPHLRPPRQAPASPT